uniref:X-linked retinitis pigmentosa GTPase regulator-like n=1 Tax=Cyprinodon variegatus TaxID=28743 RepID=A0A3Q2FJ74_CYPVA
MFPRLSEDDVYSFGLGQFGQLGHGTFIFESRLPRPVEHFQKGRALRVSCGENHTAVVTEGGLLYTFGDGRHGKLGLGEENFTNQFKPTLCPRFLKYHVQAAVCGGCHMVVLARPRDPSAPDVLLEDDDVTEDVLERPYVELLGDAAVPSLQRSLSARVRRRERERSPDQFGTMMGTLPAGFLPVPPRLPPPELSHRKVLKGSNRQPNTGSAPQEQTACRAGSVAESLTDTDSVRGLGETCDFLNMTHVMKMDPADQSLTLSPLEKDVEETRDKDEADEDEEADEEAEEEADEEAEEEADDAEEADVAEEAEADEEQEADDAEEAEADEEAEEEVDDAEEEEIETSVSSSAETPPKAEPGADGEQKGDRASLLTSRSSENNLRCPPSPAAEISQQDDSPGGEKTGMEAGDANGDAEVPSDSQSGSSRKLSLFRRLSSSRSKQTDVPSAEGLMGGARAQQGEGTAKRSEPRGPRSGACRLL